MANPTEIVDRYYPEMRWRVLSLAADLDRLQRAEAESDPRIARLRKAIDILQSGDVHRAERVQMLLSDASPLPGYFPTAEGKAR